MTTTICKPNFPKAEKAAQELLEINNVDQLPVKVKKLAMDFPNLKIKKYSWFAKKYNHTIQDVCELADSNEGCCWHFKATDEYLILYNDQVTNKGRVRWTLAHELGHYILKHNEITNKAILSRSSLSDDEYDVFEAEANCFARELLTPPPVLREINIANENFISRIGDISFKAAENVHKFLMTGAQIGIQYAPNNPVTQRFSRYIYAVKHSKRCSNCNHTFSKHNAKFCPICASNKLKNNSFYYSGGNSMGFNGIELDEQYTAMCCPRCGNENVKGVYCHVCGSHLVNKCSGFDGTEDDYYRSNIKWHSYEGGCGELLEGNARYCHSCGSTSTFFEDSLLIRWDDDSQQQAAASLDINDDDLPF